MQVRHLILAVLFMFIGDMVFGQSCSTRLEGCVVDEHDYAPLEFATVYVAETGGGAITDSNGLFIIEQLCPGSYHLSVSHIGCSTREIYINLSQDTSLSISLSHHDEVIQDVIVSDSKIGQNAGATDKIGLETIESQASRNLGQLLDLMAGVQTLNNGSNVSKPVIHGLYGNRIAIFNNGLMQAGQQWGNDHAPEIDPLAADQIYVIRGVASIEHGGNGLGGIVLVEPGAMPSDPHWHGHVHYNFETNGRGHGLNAEIRKGGEGWKWRGNFTLRHTGDKRTPDYYLTNTGKREINGTLEVEKWLSKKIRFNAYLSSFNTTLGILRGSHIGNLTDLEDAIGRDEPFFTSKDFSYKIQAPRQQVGHQLMRLSGVYIIDDQSSIHMKYGLQLNDRKEFDVRRSGRSDIPSLSLLSLDQQLNGKYTRTLGQNWDLISGLHIQYTDNENNPETGILPLIPDYEQLQSGVYGILRKTSDNTALEAGFRYTFVRLDVSRITTTLPYRIENIEHNFQNFNASASLRKTVGKATNITLSTGFGRRSPAVNELYSYGLHQGVSGIEEGNENLKVEHSWKTMLEVRSDFGDKFGGNVLFYFNPISNYIFLRPEAEPRLTIRGAFPVFIYDQTDAQLYGLDISLRYNITHSWQWKLSSNMVRGIDKNERYLAYIPADEFRISTKIDLKPIGKFTDISIEASGAYTLKQNRLDDDQDFLPPPDAYYLQSLSVGARTRLLGKLTDVSIASDNLFNVKYRAYLNRLRYFADEPGRSVHLRIKWLF